MTFLDYHGEPAPEHITRLLTRAGGKNAKGQPIYRLVQARRVLEKRAELWHDWSDTTPVEERGYMGARPLRTVAEMREVEKYPDTLQGAWILERYMPASYYPTKEEWYAEHNCVPGTSLPRLGPFPDEGAYELIRGPFFAMPSESFLMEDIAYWEQQRANLPRDVEAHVRKRVYEFERAEEKRKQKQEEELQAKMRDAISPIDTLSLAAGRWRTKMAERGGQRGHVGN